MVSNDDLDEPIEPKTRAEWVMLCAQRIDEEEGDDAPLYIATKMGQFARDGNVRAIKTYLGIAAAYDGIMQARCSGADQPALIVPVDPSAQDR